MAMSRPSGCPVRCRRRWRSRASSPSCSVCCPGSSAATATSPISPARLAIDSRDEVRRAIEEAGGQLRFDEFVRVVLYGEHGFYNGGGGRAGRRGGHFLTSPEVGPLFGAVLARAIDGWWRQLGEPDDFTLVEVGAGPGTLARAILAAEPACAPRYVTVEL